MKTYAYATANTYSFSRTFFEPLHKENMFKIGDKRDKLGHSLPSNIILYIMKTDK